MQQMGNSFEASLCCTDLCTLSIEAAVYYFTAFLIDAATEHIPQTNGQFGSRRVP